jgi:phosphatidylinositol 4-kinase
MVGYYELKKKSLFSMHKILMNFVNDNMQVHIAKGLKVSII